MSSANNVAAVPPAFRPLWYLVLTTCILWLAFHFAMAFLWVMPLNPIKWQLRYVVNAYIQPRFSQNWAFFAPVPPMQDRWVIARVRYTCAGRAIESPWVNITALLDGAVARNRISPLESVHLVLANSSGDYLNVVGATAYRNKRVVPNRVAPLDRMAMARTALATLEPAAPSGASISQIQIGLLEHDYPRFNERFQPDSHHLRVKLTEWQKSRYVAPFARVALGAASPFHGACSK